MTNTYDMLLNPPAKRPRKSENKKVDTGGQENQDVRKLTKPMQAQLPKPLSHTEEAVKTADTKSTNQPINQSVNPLINRLKHQLMNKPKGFYIPEQLDVRLDQTVEYFQRKHGLKKVDRSILLSALLEDDELWKEASLDQ